jgi:hypothetical protein
LTGDVVNIGDGDGSGVKVAIVGIGIGVTIAGAVGDPVATFGTAA